MLPHLDGSLGCRTRGNCCGAVERGTDARQMPPASEARPTPPPPLWRTLNLRTLDPKLVFTGRGRPLRSVTDLLGPKLLLLMGCMKLG